MTTSHKVHFATGIKHVSLRPICWIGGHNTYISESERLIKCRSCNKDTTQLWIRWHRFKFGFAAGLVWLANKLLGERSSNSWFHGYGQITNVDYIARSHLESLVHQGDDMLISDYLSDKGWIKLSEMKHEDGSSYTAKEQAEMISKSFTLEATRQEQEALNRED